MLFADESDAERVAVLNAALDEICRTCGIEADDPVRADVLGLLKHLYKNGHRTTEQLKVATSPAQLQAVFG
jgi:hypothetical protein